MEAIHIPHTDATAAPLSPPPSKSSAETQQASLVAYRDDQLSVEAAEQLVRLSEDLTIQGQTGEELPMADKAALLRKIHLSQGQT